MHSFTVYYSTPFDVPAPYSYQVSFEIILNENNLNVAFEMNYSNRDGLEEDEILNEGFMMDDNFAWKGDLDMVWANILDELMARTEKRMNLHDQEIIIKENGIEFAPRASKEWHILLQDLIQAVFETSGKEKPWQLELQIIKNGKKSIQLMKVLFAKRLVDFSFGANVKMDWSRSKKFMELIYLGEFDESKASTHKPEKEGVYLCFDELTWYKLGFAITNPHGNKSYLNKMQFELESLV